MSEETIPCEEPLFDWSWFWKVLRNAVIATGLFAISSFATSDFSWSFFKPVILTLLGYILIELSVKYKASPQQPTTIKTLIF